MDVIVNDASIVGQFLYDDFIEYIRMDLIPILMGISELGVEVYKDYDTWQKMPVKDVTLQEILLINGNPVITKFKVMLHKVFMNKPYWRDSIVSSLSSDYSCEIGQGINCITETYSRNATLISFKGGGYDCYVISLLVDKEEKEVYNFFDIKTYNEYINTYVTDKWKNNSFYINIDNRQFFFEVRFNEDNHAMPHFHIHDADEKYSISIPDADVLAASGRRRMENIVRSWAISNMGKIECLWQDVHEKNPEQ